MKLRSLLLAASAVALTAGSANALDLDNQTFGNVAAGDTPLVAMAPITPASEIDVTASDDAFDGFIGFNIESATTLPDAELRVSITLPAGTELDANLAAGNVTTGLATGGGPESIGSVSVISGAAGATTATLLVDITNPDTNIGFALPVRVTDCAALGSAGIAVNIVVDSNNLAVDGGDADVENPFFAACASAVAADSDVTAADPAPTLSLASDFKTLLAGDSLGTVNLELDTDVSSDFNVPVAATDLDAVSFTVTAVDGATIEDVTIGTEVVAAAMATPNVFEFDLTQVADAALIGTLSNGVADSVDIDIEPTVAADPGFGSQGAAIVSDIEVDLFDGSATVTGGSLSGIDRQVSAGGTFEWTSETNALSVFRITGLTAPTTMVVTTTNSNLGAAGNGSWTGTVTPVNGEAVVTSQNGFGVSAAGFGRADVSFEFESTDPIDVDRLVVQSGEIFELQSTTD